MTIGEQNIINRWDFMASKDLGIDRIVEAKAFAQLFKEVFENGNTQPNGSIYINSIIRGFAINEDLEDEVSVIECLNLNYINITKYGARELDSYLMDKLGWFDIFQFAQTI